MKDFYYVYILVSESDCETHYTGITHDLTQHASQSTTKVHVFKRQKMGRGKLR